MPSDTGQTLGQPLVLAFDTSAAHCAAALLSGDRILAARVEPMARGQAERLAPLLEEVMAEGGAAFADLDALGVGTGPGNFTGIRIAVSLARGFALALKVPAIGVTGFEVLALDAPRPLLATLPAPRETFYAQLITDTDPGTPEICAAGAIPAHLAPEGVTLAGCVPGARPAPENPAIAIARIAARRMGSPVAAPAPVYLRPADAAPPRDAPPRILP